MTAAPFTFCRFAGDESLTPAEVRALIESGKIGGTTLLQRSDSRDWKPASEFPELKSAFDVAPKRPRKPLKVLKGFQPKFTGPEEVKTESFRWPWSQRTGIRLTGALFALMGILALASNGGPTFRRLAATNWRQVEATAINWSDYQYRVNERRYTGRHPDGHLHRGDHLRVFYDPAEPAKSMIDNSVEPYDLFRSLLCAVFAIIGIVVIVAPEKFEQGGSAHAG